MDERTHEYTEQQPETTLGQYAADVTPPPATPLWRRRSVQIGAVIVALAGIGIGFAANGSGPSQIHVRGTLQLGPLSAVAVNDPAVDGAPCEAGAGYNDITPGATVTVGGAQGQTLGVGALSGGIERNVDTSLGMALGDCVFSFDVVVPDGQSAYTVAISHRGTQTFTPSEAAAGIALTLGQ